MIWYIPKHRGMAFCPEILSTDKSVNEENVVKISAQKNVSFLRYCSPKNQNIRASFMGCEPFLNL